MSSRSSPSAILAGIEAAGLPFEGRGASTWALTIPSTVAASKPPASRAAAKASSRLGPMVAVVPAWASVRQTPHLEVKRTRPRAMSGFVVPQPEITMTVATRATMGKSRRMGLGRFCITGEAGRSLYVEAPVTAFATRVRQGTFASNRTSAFTRQEEAGNAGEGWHVRGLGDGGAVAHAAPGGGGDGGVQCRRRAGDRRRGADAGDRHRA